MCAVYLVRAGATDKVKIGYAGNVSRRLMSLQSAHWERLVLLRTWDGGMDTEEWVQHQFAELRFSRDWFTFDQRMMTIEAPLSRSAPRQKRGNDPKFAPLYRIVSIFGGQVHLGIALNVSQGTVSHWLETGTVPYQKIVQTIHAAANLATPVALRPSDFFPCADIAA